MIGHRPVLAFISPVFLFPNDAGGKIRTTNILRGLRGGHFHVVLASPADAAQQQRWATEIAGVCDEFVAWEPVAARSRWQRVGDVWADVPVNVCADRTPAAQAAVSRLVTRPEVDLVVFDFVHAAVLRPSALRPKTVCFTHNVEAEIFERHAATAAGLPMRWLWAQQARKMRAFEGTALNQFDGVVAVSDRDARQFVQRYGVPAERLHTIPTGVDLDFFAWQAPRPSETPTVVFTGSMDWEANTQGVAWFLREVWPAVRQQIPSAQFKVIGKRPPAWLTALGGAAEGVTFTGFVDDVRPHAHGAQAFVIPLLVGGGTRIKAFEAMAMGTPVVSTGLGIEGLPVQDGREFLQADTPAAMAQAVTRLLVEPPLATGLSRAARQLVESRFGHRAVAEVFENACIAACGTPQHDWKAAA